MASFAKALIKGIQRAKRQNRKSRKNAKHKSILHLARPWPTGLH
jgi:hypothetical protein